MGATIYFFAQAQAGKPLEFFIEKYVQLRNHIVCHSGRRLPLVGEHLR